MSRRLLLLLSAALLSGMAAPLDGRGPGAAPQAELLRPVREAIGIPRTRVTALVLRGAIRRFDALSGAPIEPNQLELRILLPDNYLRIETSPRTVRHVGFSGETVLHKLEQRTAGGRVRSSVSPDYIRTARAELARLVLGMLAETGTALKLEVQARAPRTFTVTGPDRFNASLELDESRVPARLQYVRPRPLLMGTGGGKAASPDTKTTTSGAEDVAMRFDDRRIVNGLKLPFHILVAADGKPTEEMRFEQAIVNPPLGPSDFQYAVAGAQR